MKYLVVAITFALLLSVPALAVADEKDDIMRGGSLREQREAPPKQHADTAKAEETPAKTEEAAQPESGKSKKATIDDGVSDGKPSERVPGKQYKAWPDRVISTKIGKESRSAYLMANTVFKVGGNLKPGFYWSNFGGDPFFKMKGVTFDDAAGSEQFWNVNILPKMESAVGVAESLKIAMPQDDQIKTCLENPNDPTLWKDGFIRHKDEFAFGVGGSPNVEGVKHPGNGPTDDYAVYVNVIAINPGHRAAKRTCELQWDDAEWTYKREVVEAKTCFNGPLFTHVRKLKKVRKAEEPQVTMERELTPPEEQPEGDDEIPTAATPPRKFDRRDEGWSLGGQIFTSASTGAKVDSKGDLKTDSMEFVQYAARADGYYVKQLSDDPRDADNYLRFYVALGGRYFTNLTEGEDEVAGAGAGLDLQGMAEYVALVGDNQDVAARIDLQGNLGSNATRHGVQAAVDTHPRTGRGLGGSLSFSDTFTGVDEGTDVDGRIIDARLTYQALKKGEFTPLPGGSHWTLYLGYDDQEYSSDQWTTSIRGPKLGTQLLLPINRWRECGQDEECNVAPFIFFEAYVQDAHVTAEDAAGNTLVDDNVLQGHGFLGVRFEF